MVVLEAGNRRARGVLDLDQPVFRVVDERLLPVAGQVAVGLMGVRLAVDRGELVGGVVGKVVVVVLPPCVTVFFVRLPTASYS